MNIQELLEWRYATKSFDTDKKVSEEDLNGILQEANLSATSYGLQPFEFIVVNDPKTKEALMEHSFGQKQIVESSYLIILAARTDVDTDYITEYTERIEKTRGLKKGDVDDFKNMMIAAFSNHSQDEKVVWAQKQTYIALSTLMLAAAARKIDGCPMEGFDSSAYDKVLGLAKKNLRSTVLFTIGYRSEEDETQHYAKVRKPLNDIVIRM